MILTFSGLRIPRIISNVRLSDFQKEFDIFLSQDEDSIYHGPSVSQALSQNIDMTNVALLYF